MAVTVRGVTYTDTVPGTIALPTGTAAGDVLVLAMYRLSSTDPDYYPKPDSSALDYYTPSAADGVWQVVDGEVLGAGASVVYQRLAVAADITAGTVTLANDADVAALISFTGGHLMILPADYNSEVGTKTGPIYTDNWNIVSESTNQCTSTFSSGYPVTMLYIGVMSATDADASLDTGTVLLNSPGSQQIIASYYDNSAAASVTVTMIAHLGRDWTPTTFDGALLFPLEIREIGQPSTDGADNFADAKLVTLAADGDTYISPVIFNRTYTTETGEPLHHYDWGDGTFDDVGHRSAWWTYTPATTGTLTIDTALSPGDGHADTVMFLFTGSSVDDLTEVGYNDDQAIGMRSSQIIADVDNGRTYHIKVGTWYDTDDLYYCLRLTGPASGEPTAGNLTLDCPPMQAEVTALSVPDPLTGPDNFADARAVTITVDNDTFTTRAYDNSTYTTETGEPHPDMLRTAWWTYAPLHSGNATLTTAGSLPDWTLLELHVFTGTAVNALTEVAAGRSLDDPDNIARITFYVYAGTTYHIQLGDDHVNSVPSNVVLTVQGPANVGDPVMAVDVPPISAAVTDVVVAPVRLAAGNPSPPDLTVVPTIRPTFSINVARGEPEPVDVTVTINVGADSTAVLHTFSTTATLSFTNNTISLTAPLDLPTGHIYYWDAVVTYNGIVIYGDVWIRFTVASTSSTTTTVPVTWTVTAGSPAPHLWFVYPAAGKPGDQITAVGQGASTGTITVNGTTATVVSFTQIAATSATTGRTIDPYTGTADAEHFAAVFTVPDIGAPGGPVVVTS